MSRGVAIKSVRWTASGNMVRTILATIQLLIVARLVSVAEFGLAVLVSSLVMLAQQISDAGFSSALIRFRDVTAGEKSSLFWFNALIGLVLSIVVALLGPSLARAFASERLVAMLYIVAPVFLAQGLYLQLRVLAEREMRFADVVKLEITSACGGFAVTVSLAVLGYGAFSVAWGQMANVIIQLALSWAFLTRDWRPEFHFQWQEISRFVPYGFDIFLVNLTTSLTIQLDVLISGLFFPKDVFGSFAQPRDLCLKVMSSINPVVTRVGLPVIAQLQDDPVRAGEVYLRVIRMSASVCFPIYAGMALLAGDLLPALLGRQWTEAAALMPYIALWFAFRCIVNPLGSYMYAMGRSRHALWYQVAFATVVAVAAYIGSQFGAVILAMSMAVAYLIFSEVCWFFVLRPISHVRFMAYHRQIYIPLLCTMLGAFTVELIRGAFSNGLWPLVGGLVAGGAVFSIASLTMNRTAVGEVSKLLGLSKFISSRQ